MRIPRKCKDRSGTSRSDETSHLQLADTRARWLEAVAREVYKVAMLLVKRNRERRITVATARQRLEALLPAPPPVVGDMFERECVLCLSAPRHVRFACGHSQLCRSCVRLYLQRPAPTCILCRAPLSHDDVFVGDDVARQETFVCPR